MIAEKYINQVFDIENDNLFLPNQIFVNKEFDFLLTIGGNLTDNEIEYQKLMSVFKSLGETEFFVVKNSNKKNVFSCKIPTNSNFDFFQEVGKNYDNDFGWFLGDFFIFGKNNIWGIYMCECPAINIIGCNKTISNKFRDVYDIKTNGYAEIKEFITSELIQPDLIKTFENNYAIS
ncbi:MAG: hypothetical protein LBS50_10365 [Prevotellaceae bacterium]|jgi:hypothetical protein|nr:hypothetical protein [Prevotellaceae bacterium]